MGQFRYTTEQSRKRLDGTQDSTASITAAFPFIFFEFTGSGGISGASFIGLFF